MTDAIVERDVQVLSAGAPKTGVRQVADAFEAAGRGKIVLRFATAPTIRGEIASGTALPDVVVLPPGGMQEIAGLGKVDDATRVMLGRIGAGVAVREAAFTPDISSVEALKRELVQADTIAYNKASTGLYIEALFAKLDLAAALAPKIRRQDNGAGVMNHLLHGGGRDIGFGAITEILVFADKGVRFVGPLPDAIQNYTRYEAVVMRQASNLAGARAFIELLGSTEGRRLLAACGIEAARG